jgi:hypothetical protein
MASALSSVNMKRIYFFYILIILGVSCNSAPDLKSHGVILSEVDSIPTIDTSNNIVRPVTLAARRYHLTNKSIDHSINFICKAYLKGDSDVISEETEKHVVAPQETIDLKNDRSSNSRVIKFEIIEAHAVNK